MRCIFGRAMYRGLSQRGIRISPDLCLEAGTRVLDVRRALVVSFDRGLFQSRTCVVYEMIIIILSYSLSGFRHFLCNFAVGGSWDAHITLATLLVRIDRLTFILKHIAGSEKTVHVFGGE